MKVTIKPNKLISKEIAELLSPIMTKAAKAAKAARAIKNQIIDDFIWELRKRSDFSEIEKDKFAKFCEAWKEEHQDIDCLETS